MARETRYRQIPSFPDRVQNINLNDVVRLVMERIYSEQGRRGPIEKKDALYVTSDDHNTPLRFRGRSTAGSGSIGFSGRNGASMFMGKGCHINDNGSWVAEADTATILELNRDALAPIMYRNTGLTVGQIFQPTEVGEVITGSTPSPGGGAVLTVGDLYDSNVSAVVNGQVLQYNGSEWVPGDLVTSHGGTVLTPTIPLSAVVWRCPYPCEVSAVKGYMVGGALTGTYVNARKNGTDNHLASNLQVTATDTWLDGGVVQNTSYVAGDKLEILLTALGSPLPSQVAVQVDFVRV